MVTTARIFFSYAWANTTIANEIDRYFQDLNISLTRDVRDLQYGADIKCFTETIVSHDFMLLLVSDDYLKSKHCMLEVAVLLGSTDNKARILPILNSDYPNIYKLEDRIQYYDHWGNLYDEALLLNQKYNNQDSLNELKNLRTIQNSIDSFFTLLIAQNAKTLEQLKKDCFSQLLNIIDYEDCRLSEEVLKISQTVNMSQKTQCVRIFLEKHKGTINGLFYQAWFSADLKQYDLAIKQYNLFLTKYGNRDTVKIWQAHNNLGIIWLYLRKYENALYHFIKVTELNSQHEFGNINLADILRNHFNNCSADAITCYKKALAINPKNVNTLFKLGSLQCEIKQFDAAILSFLEALKIAPHHTGILNYLGAIYYNQGGNDTLAREYFEAALKADPKNAIARQNLSLVNKNVGILEKIKAVFRRAF